jgi:hypothetical protein
LGAIYLQRINEGGFLCLKTTTQQKAGESESGC